MDSPNQIKDDWLYRLRGMAYAGQGLLVNKINKRATPVTTKSRQKIVVTGVPLLNILIIFTPYKSPC